MAEAGIAGFQPARLGGEAGAGAGIAGFQPARLGGEAGGRVLAFGAERAGPQPLP